MAIIFAAYIPDFARMVPQLMIQLVILAALAAALIAYNRQFSRLAPCVSAVIGGGLAGNLLVLCLQAPYGVDGEFAIAFFELWAFSVSGACGMVVGGIGLAVFSKVAARFWNSAAPENGPDK